ncbi:carbohydrate ABC transporter permease [Conexibacter woesei]|uniref:Binding-protein-dependent transport systems inner membrane component n=1 Tax=Conexibacter woesei (strain DSM 14684 / CCUG 47730 / CIP 108061 / JCM 11494 / NBRC 100937 / ID131577) TaxID=469383 RepID=D3F2S0_CONWI|nr:carbohydrate ABC transporter permease [Conexibacter woesei]ADB54201.1 binding-protein-dependent transport systems inner membrane component [Conexibacter woesei DSM 14684]
MRRRLKLPFDPWHLALLPATLLLALPLLWMLIASFMSSAQLNRFPPTIIPSSLHLEGYTYLFDNVEIGTWFTNSLIVSSVCVVSNVIFCSTAGYAFARMRFRGSKVMLTIMLATLIIPFQLTLIPTFIIMEKLGLIDTLGALIVPSLVTPFGVFLLRQFFLSLPPELEEAAYMDGCSRWKILWTIVLPLARPALATVAVVTFLLTWNDVSWPAIAISSDANNTLPLGVASFRSRSETNPSAIMAANVIATLPVLLAFLAAQKTFVRSIASGAVKG